MSCKPERLLPLIALAAVLAMLLLQFAGLDLRPFLPVNARSKRAVETPKTSPIPASGYKAAKTTGKTRKGMKLFGEKKCALCHSIGGYGGCLGPLLDGVGARRSKEYLLARITDTDEQIERFEELTGGLPELMPHIRMSPADSAPIVAYLLTLPEPSGGFEVTGHPEDTSVDSTPVAESFTPAAGSQSSERGRKLYQSNGCAGCHAIGNVGGQFAPPLDGIGSRRTRESIVNKITSGELQITAVSGEKRPVRFMMPPANLSGEEIEQITDFLLTLPDRK